MRKGLIGDFDGPFVLFEATSMTMRKGGRNQRSQNKQDFLVESNGEMEEIWYFFIL